MPNKKFKAVNLWVPDHVLVQQIRLRKDMLADDGAPRSVAAILHDVLVFYVEAHQKGAK